MGMISEPFTLLDHSAECFRIAISGSLTGLDTQLLRTEVEKAIASKYTLVYIDVKDVTEADLSGINEIIHAHYTLDKAAKKLVLLYQKNSVVEQWVETSGLDKFVATAIVPTN